MERNTRLFRRKVSSFWHRFISLISVHHISFENISGIFVTIMVRTKHLGAIHRDSVAIADIILVSGHVVLNPRSLNFALFVGHLLD